MSGRLSRNKGKVYEREIAAFLRRWWPDSRRGWQSRSGDDEADVEATPFWVECKVGAAPNVWRALLQAEEATDGRVAVCFIKRNQKRPGVAAEEFVAMRRESFQLLMDRLDIDALPLSAAKYAELIRQHDLGGCALPEEED